METRIIIVEDDRFMREELEYTLKKAGYAVESVTDFSNTVAFCMEVSADLILLDLNLPYKNGFEICKELKSKTQIPILILTSRDQLKDELQALSLGADEFLNKPCNSSRLLARIENLLKRFSQQKEEGKVKAFEKLLDGDGVLLDPDTNTVYVGETSMLLPNKEGRILQKLLLKKGELVTKEELFVTLWGTTEYIDENALQVTMTRLRKDLAGLSIENRIRTVRGKGYCFVTENAAQKER